MVPSVNQSKANGRVVHLAFNQAPELGKMLFFVLLDLDWFGSWFGSSVYLHSGYNKSLHGPMPMVLKSEFFESLGWQYPHLL